VGNGELGVIGVLRVMIGWWRSEAINGDENELQKWKGIMVNLRKLKSIQKA